MKKIYFLSSFFILFAFVPLSKEEPIIVWSSTPLTWNDFNGKMKKRATYDAVTVSAIGSKFSGKSSTLIFDIEAIFFKNSSKKKSDKQSNALLKHEQGHFNITEIFARKLRQTIQKKKYKSYETISKIINQAYNKNNLAWQKMQNQYDRETQHSKKEEKQEELDIKIKKELAKLDHFKTSHFTVDISYLNK